MAKVAHLSRSHCKYTHALQLPGLKKLQFSGTNVQGTLEDICECCPKIAAIYIADTNITGEIKDLVSSVGAIRQHHRV